VFVGGPIVAGFMNWLAPAVRAAVLSLAPPAAAALASVMYFNWRERLKRRILGDAERDRYKTKFLAQSERRVFRKHAV
jgi:hypothetical protein